MTSLARLAEFCNATHNRRALLESYKVYGPWARTDQPETVECLFDYLDLTYLLKGVIVPESVKRWNNRLFSLLTEEKCDHIDHGEGWPIIDGRYPLVIAKISNDFGYGVFALCDIPRGAYLFEYSGIASALIYKVASTDTENFSQYHVVATEPSSAIDFQNKPVSFYQHHNLPRYRMTMFSETLSDDETRSILNFDRFSDTLEKNQEQEFRIHFSVDSTHIGNVARFVNGGKASDRVCNVIESGCWDLELGIRRMYYRTSVPISAGQQIISDYGISYWMRFPYDPVVVNRRLDSRLMSYFQGA